MGRQAIIEGPTSINVVQNITRIRGTEGLRAVSARITARALDHTQLWAIEAGRRRVDVDDLVAIAAALGVSPVSLLMPHTKNPRSLIVSSAMPEAVTAQRYWRWLIAEAALGKTSRVDFQIDARPIWAEHELPQHIGTPAPNICATGKK